MTDNSLFSLPLFRGIQEEEISRLLEAVRLRKRKYSKREMIHLQGAGYNSLYIVIKGTCYGEMNLSGDKILKVEEFQAPNTIALGILFASHNILPVSLIAAGGVELAIIPKEDIIRIWLKNETLLKNFLEDISEKIFLLSRRLEILSFTTIKGKIARYILSRDREQFTLKTSMDDLAQYLGVTRPSLSRSMAELVEEGLITKEKKIIRVLDQSALEDLLS